MATTKKNTKREKRDNGDGYITLRKDGRWHIKIQIDGVLKQMYAKTEAEAKRKLKDYKKFRAQGHIDAKKIKLNEYIEQWLYRYVLGNVEDSTFDRYENTYLHHIKETIGNIQLGSIKAIDIQNLLDAKMGKRDDNGYCKGKKALSYSSTIKIKELLNQCFKHAVKHKEMDSNPVELILMPKRKLYPVKTKEAYSLTDDEMQAIKAVADKVRKNGQPLYRYAWVYMVILNTGLRVGEAIALEWEAIDFDKKIMKVYEAVQSNVKMRDEDGKSINKRHSPLSDTKTEDGMRTVTLNNTAITYLTLLKEYAEKHKIKTSYVAYTDKGTRVSARNLQRTLDLVADKANIPHLGLHILRHTFGSTLLRKGVDVSVVSELMGHANIYITYRTYIHIIKEQKAQAVKLIDVI